jgi:D-amino-acid dehydrogenase
MNQVAFACRIRNTSLERLITLVAPTYPSVNHPELRNSLERLDLLVSDDPAGLEQIALTQGEAIAGINILCVYPVMDSHVSRLSESLKKRSARVMLRESTLGLTNNVLRDIEQRYLRRGMIADGYHSLLNRGPADGGHVILIGAGIVNLVTAWTLANSGFRVTILERSPDPRKSPDSWRKHGCTHGGANARIFSLNESRNHTLRFFMSADGGVTLGDFFRRNIEENGWLARQALTSDEQSWISRHNGGNRWMMEVYEEDIVSFNQESELTWREWQEQYPALFQNTHFRAGVLRTYATEEQMKNAVMKEARIGSLRRILTPELLCSDYPALLPAVLNGDIKGAIEVQGFSLGIHSLSRNFMDALESRGARIAFDTDAVSFDRTDGEISGVVTNNGVLSADHFVICPGAYGENLIADLGIRNQIHSVLGAWYKLDQDVPRLPMSMKYTRAGTFADGAAEGANIVLGEENGKPVIWVSSGHAYIGKDARSASPDEVERIFRAVRDTVRALFPKHFAEIQRQGGFTRQDIRYCIRPWARECLGIFSISPAHKGKVVVTGAHNTGGFAQAPSVGRAVLDCLRGEEHPMHRLYHPDRTTQFENAIARRPVTGDAPIVWMKDRQFRAIARKPWIRQEPR